MTKRPHTVIALLVVMAGCAFAQQPTQSNRAFLEEKLDRFRNYSTSFNALPRRSGVEREITDDLRHIAEITEESLLSAEVCLHIYAQLSCQADREKTWLMIKPHLNYYATQIDVEIKVVNLNLSQTKDPALGKSGTQMKEDLRELKAFLESIGPPGR